MLQQSGLKCGVTCKRYLIMVTKSFEYRLGIFEYCPFITFLNNPCISSDLNGGFSVHISYNTHPNDHISAFLS